MPKIKLPIFLCYNHISKLSIEIIIALSLPASFLELLQFNHNHSQRQKQKRENNCDNL